MKNFNSNHTCSQCGRDSKSHKLGSYIINGVKAIREADPQTDALNVFIPLKRPIEQPKNYAHLTFNPWN